MSEPPAAPAKPKKNSIKARAAARAAARASKRRRISGALDSGAEDGGDEATEHEVEPAPAGEDDGLGGMKWECVTVTLADVQQFLGTIEKTRDANEKVLRDQIQEHLVPILEGQEERRKRREKDRERELLSMAKMANAKRSSRIAGKAERQREEEMAREADHRRLLEEAAARREENERRKLERERDNRLMSREQRLREREARRLQHEEELAQLSEDSRHLSSTSGRLSERRLQQEIEKNKQALKDLEEEEEEWVFDCVCGLHGQVDDGEHSVSCERCNVWQHSKCLDIAEVDAESDDFHFICDSCTRRQAEKDRPRPSRPVIKIKVNRPGPPSVQPADKQGRPASQAPRKPAPLEAAPPRMVVEIPSKPLAQTPHGTEGPQANGAPARPPPPVSNGLYRPDAVLMPPTEKFSINIPVKGPGAATQQTSPEARRLSGSHPKGLHNSFTSPHPELSPPDQSPTKAVAYGTLYDPSSPDLSRSRGRPTTNGANATRPGEGYPLKASGPNGTHAPQAGQNQQAGVAIKGTAPPASAFFSSPVISPPASNPQTQKQQPGSMVTPKAGVVDGRSGQGYDPKASMFLPAREGISPTKHSPSLTHTPLSRGLPSSSPTPPILPPVATLSPFPREQDLTPPVKPSGMPPQVPTNSASSGAQASRFG